MKKIFKVSLISSSIFLMSMNTAFATSYQIFSGLSFTNPATLNTIKDGEIIVGDTTLFSRFQFSGTADGVPGYVSSNTTDYLPYGRFARRLTPKIVFSFDITQPYYTNIQYPNTSFADMFSTSTVLRDVNYSPKLSFQVNDRLALGIGFDANDMYNAQLNFAVPPYGNMKNEANGWAYGWDVGLSYMLTQATIFNFSYYSRILQHVQGYSSWGPITAPDLTATSVLPATFIANLIQFFSAQWLVSATARYSQWDSLQYIVLNDSAIGNVTIPYHFYNNVSAELATRYQINTNWAALGAFDYEPNVQPTATRNIGLPTYTRYYPTIGAEYQIIKGLKAKLMYTYVFSRPPINMNITPTQNISGTEQVHVNAIDLSLAYDF